MFAIGLLLAGLVAETFEGINKIAATPTWCLWSAAPTCIAWMVLYRIIDVGGHRGWSILVGSAGSNPLVAYFLHPIVVESLGLGGLGEAVLRYEGSPVPWVAVAGSIAKAVFICGMTGSLGRPGLRAKP